MACSATHSYAEVEGGQPGKTLNQMTKKDLYARAQKLNIKGRSKMMRAAGKEELVAAVRNKYKQIGDNMRRKGKGKGKATKA